MVSSISNIWFMSLSQLLESVQCLLHSAEFAAVLWLLGPWGHPHPVVYLISACVVLSLYLCCLVVLYCGIVVLADSSSWHFPPPPPPALTAGFLVGGLFSIYLFYLFIHLFMFSSTEPFGSSVTGAQRELGARGLQLDCGLGRPVRCSSTLGCDCSCSSWAPWASSFHLWCGCKLDIKLFLYLFGIFIQAGSVWLWKAGLHCLYKW